MSVSFKVRNATQLGQTDLCMTCESATIWHDERGEHRACNGMSRSFQPAGRVSQCNVYTDSRVPSIRDMYATAWTLRTEKDGRQIGFTPPKPRERGPFDDE